MFISIPVFSVNSVPARLKMMLSLLITFAVVPTLPPMPAVALFSPEGLMVTIQQVMLGISTGFILQMVFSIMVRRLPTAWDWGLPRWSILQPACKPR